jgi:hypothetical protein
MKLSPIHVTKCVRNVTSKDKSYSIAVILDTYSTLHNSVSALVQVLCMSEYNVTKQAEEGIQFSSLH